MVNIHCNGCEGNLISREISILAENHENNGSVIFFGRSVSLATARLCLSCLSKVGKIWHSFFNLQARPFLQILSDFFEKKFTEISIKSGKLYASFNFDFGPITIVQQRKVIMRNVHGAQNEGNVSIEMSEEYFQTKLREFEEKTRLLRQELVQELETIQIMRRRQNNPHQTHICQRRQRVLPLSAMIASERIRL